MDRRSWLWRRKSSEKSPGETESSGSLSSHSERFSDDQEGSKAYPNNSAQSPEVTSKATSRDEEVNDSVRILSDKLSAAILNISAKEDLVKQHAKVAEEAVSGWEKAESEVFSLRQQLDASNQKNSSLEDRVGHVDGALKECLRQLRQAREEQEHRINEAVTKKTREFESTKTELENQILRAKSVASINHDLQSKLEAYEKENSTLKLELLSRAEELEFRTLERDLSTQAAETASKQHLEIIKKVAKLESESRRIKVMAARRSSITASSVYVDSLTDSQSDNGERLLSIEAEAHKCEPSHSDSWASALITEKSFGKNLMVPSPEIDLMDDFLEMERLAALPETETPDREITLRSELEERLEKIEAEKMELETGLSACQERLKKSQLRVKETEAELSKVRSELSLANKAKLVAEEVVEATNAKRKVVESRVLVLEAEIEKLVLHIGVLEREVENERALSMASGAKCRKLEDELSRIKREEELRQLAISSGELKIKQDKELAVAASKLADCQKTIASLDRQLKSLATLEDFLIVSEGPIEEEEPQISWKSHNRDFSDSSKMVTDCSKDTLVSDKNNPNGFGKLFSGSKRSVRNEIQ